MFELHVTLCSFHHYVRLTDLQKFENEGLSKIFIEFPFMWEVMLLYEYIAEDRMLSQIGMIYLLTAIGFPPGGSGQ